MSVVRNQVGPRQFGSGMKFWSTTSLAVMLTVNLTTPTVTSRTLPISSDDSGMPSQRTCCRNSRSCRLTHHDSLPSTNMSERVWTFQRGVSEVSTRCSSDTTCLIKDDDNAGPVTQESLCSIRGKDEWFTVLVVVVDRTTELMERLTVTW